MGDDGSDDREQLAGAYEWFGAGAEIGGSPFYAALHGGPLTWLGKTKLRS